ncbi:wat1-related protein at4g30420, partial [Phtheirospermum japonicum]
EEQKNVFVGLGWKSFWLIFVLSFVGVTINQNIFFEGLHLASSSAASASANLIPAITFVMAYTLGLEKVHLRSLRNMAKVNVTACYPDHLSLTAWMCLMAALQSAILTFIVEPNTQSWKFNSPLQLFCCFYVGLASAITFFAQAWCIARRGPLFSAMFNPLCTVIVTVFACIFLHEELYTGSVMGGIGCDSWTVYCAMGLRQKDYQSNKEETISQIQNQNDGNDVVYSSLRIA